MALNASDVNAGDNILAAHNNALIDDIEQHTHEGTDTTKVKADNLDVSTGNVPANGVGTASLENDAVTASKLDDTDNFTVNTLLATQGIAPGGDECLLWDVVGFMVDGTSPDSVGYAGDESKFYGILTCGHTIPSIAVSTTDTSIESFTYISYSNNNLNLNYGILIGAGDNVQTILFYVL